MGICVRAIDRGKKIESHSKSGSRKLLHINFKDHKEDFKNKIIDLHMIVAKFSTFP